MAKPTGLIALMGGTGSGKSSFINAVIGENKAPVGDGLESLTCKVEEYTYYAPSHGVTVQLVDTPGFDDYREDEANCLSDFDILQQIAEFLKEQHARGQKFSGIIYLQGVTTSKVGKMARKSMKIFEEICGYASMKNVVVVTTFWDQLSDADEGLLVEDELKTEGLLQGLFDNGASLARTGVFTDDRPPPEGIEFRTPKEIVESLLSLDQVFVKMQVEMADGVSLSDTSAGVKLVEEFEQLKREYRESLEALNREMKDLKSASEEGKSHREALRIESDKVKDRLRSWEMHGQDLQTKFAEWEQRQIQVATKEELEIWQNVHRKEFDSLHRHVEELMKAKADSEALLAKRNTELSAALEKVEKERDALSSECSQLRVSFQTMGSELRERHAELSAQMRQTSNSKQVEEELDKTKTSLLQTKDLLLEARDELFHAKEELQQTKTKLQTEQREKEALQTQIKTLQLASAKAAANAEALKKRRAQVKVVKEERERETHTKPAYQGSDDSRGSLYGHNGYIPSFPSLPLGAGPPGHPPPPQFPSAPGMNSGPWQGNDGSWPLISPALTERNVLPNGPPRGPYPRGPPPSHNPGYSSNYTGFQLASTGHGSDNGGGWLGQREHY